MRIIFSILLATAALVMVSGDCIEKYPSCPALEEWCVQVPWVGEDCQITCGTCVVETTASNAVPARSLDLWSTCSKTCGDGTRYKSTSDGGREYEECNTHACSTAFCIGQSRRGGIPHACCTSQFPEPSCGVPIVGGRVVGGVATVISQHPWTALIKTDGSVFCAAVIISHQWLLSAGHCFRNSTTFINYDYSSWRVYVGLTLANDMYSWSYPADKIKQIDYVVFHYEHAYPKADIVLIKVRTNMTFTNEVKPACLPGGESPAKDTKCFIAGWGISNPSTRQLTNNLQEAAVNIFDLELCRNAYKNTKVKDFLAGESRLLCAGNLHSLTDACGGDSGGPLVCQRCSSCTYYVAGIVSFGSGTCDQTAKPGIYTKVRDYETWIAQVSGLYTSAPYCPETVGP